MDFSLLPKDLPDPSLDTYNYKLATDEMKPRAGMFDISKIKTKLEMGFPFLFKLMVGFLSILVYNADSKWQESAVILNSTVKSAAMSNSTVKSAAMSNSQ